MVVIRGGMWLSCGCIVVEAELITSLTRGCRESSGSQLVSGVAGSVYGIGRAASPHNWECGGGVKEREHCRPRNPFILFPRSLYLQYQWAVESSQNIFLSSPATLRVHKPTLDTFGLAESSLIAMFTPLQPLIPFTVEYLNIDILWGGDLIKGCWTPRSGSWE